MDESRMIEKAKANWAALARLRITDAELAVWMFERRTEMLYLHTDGRFVKRSYPNDPLLENGIYRLRPDYEAVPRVDIEALRAAVDDADKRYRDALEVSWQAFCVVKAAKERLADAMKAGAQ